MMTTTARELLLESHASTCDKVSNHFAPKMIPKFRRLGLGLFPERKAEEGSSEESEEHPAHGARHDLLERNGSGSIPNRSSILPREEIAHLLAGPKPGRMSNSRNPYALQLFNAQRKKNKPKRSQAMMVTRPEPTLGANEEEFPPKGESYRFLQDKDQIELVEKPGIFSDLRERITALCYFLAIPMRFMLQMPGLPNSHGSNSSPESFQIRVLMVRLTDPSSVNAAVDWLLDENKSKGCIVGLDCQPSSGTELNLIQLSVHRRCVLIHMPTESNPTVRNPESLVNLLENPDFVKTGTMMEIHSFAIFWVTGMFVNGCKNVSDAHGGKKRPMDLLSIFRKLYQWIWFKRPDIANSDFGRAELTAWQIKYAILNAWSSRMVALEGMADVATLSLGDIPPQVLKFFGRAIIDAQQEEGSLAQETSGTLTTAEYGNLQLVQHDYRTRVRGRCIAEVHLTDGRPSRKYKVQSFRGKVVVLAPLDKPQSHDQSSGSGLTRSSNNITTDDIAGLTILEREKVNWRVSRLEDALVHILRNPQSCPAHLLLLLGSQSLEAHSAFLETESQKIIFKERDLNSPVFQEISSKLNDSQREAWRDILTSPLSATIGPPGTGKTSLISAVAKSCIKSIEMQNVPEVLVCTAYQNVAVRHIAETLQEAQIPGILLLVSEDHYSGWHEGSYLHLGLSLVISSTDLIEFSSSLAAWRARNNGMEHPYLVLCTTDLVGCQTFSSCLMGGKITGLIIDESSQASDISLLHMLLSLPDLVMMSVLGDPHQLPPYGAANDQSKTSVFDLATKSCKVNFLREQYRMPECVCDFLSQEVYSKRLVTAPHRLKEKEITPLVWCHVRGIPSCGQGKTSLSNSIEANAVVGFCVSLVKERGIACEKIVVLTLYEEQNKMISSDLSERGLQVPVHNVDSFQGQQCDIVLISLVVGRSFSPFAADLRRACVMLSRVRRLLCVYGDFDEVRKNNQAGLWCKLANFCRKQSFVVDVANADCFLEETLEAVKRMSNPAPGEPIPTPEESHSNQSHEREEPSVGIAVRVLIKKR